MAPLFFFFFQKSNGLFYYLPSRTSNTQAQLSLTTNPRYGTLLEELLARLIATLALSENTSFTESLKRTSCILHYYASTIPFYHADEASEAIQKVMGSHYRTAAYTWWTGFLKALRIGARTYQWVEPTAGSVGEGKAVLFFRNKNGIGVPPAKIAN